MKKYSKQELKNLCGNTFLYDAIIRLEKEGNLIELRNFVKNFCYSQAEEKSDRILKNLGVEA